MLVNAWIFLISIFSESGESMSWLHFDLLWRLHLASNMVIKIRIYTICANEQDETLLEPTKWSKRDTKDTNVSTDYMNPFTQFASILSHLIARSPPLCKNIMSISWTDRNWLCIRLTYIMWSSGHLHGVLKHDIERCLNTLMEYIDDTLVVKELGR